MKWCHDLWYVHVCFKHYNSLLPNKMLLTIIDCDVFLTTALFTITDVDYEI